VEYMGVNVRYLTARVGPTDERAICADERLEAMLWRIDVIPCIVMKFI